WFDAIFDCLNCIAETMNTNSSEKLDLDAMFDFINAIFSEYSVRKTLTRELNFTLCLNRLDEHFMNNYGGLSLVKILLSQLKNTTKKKSHQLAKLIDNCLNLIQIVLLESSKRFQVAQHACMNSLIAWIGRCIPANDKHGPPFGIFQNIDALHVLLTNYLYVPASRMYSARFDAWFKCLIFVGQHKQHFLYYPSQKIFPFISVNDLIIQHKPNQFHFQEFQQYHHLWDFALHANDYNVIENAIKTIVQLHAGFGGTRDDAVSINTCIYVFTYVGIYVFTYVGIYIKPPSGIQILLDKCLARVSELNQPPQPEKTGTNPGQKITDQGNVERLRNALIIRKCLELPLGVINFGGISGNPKQKMKDASVSVSVSVTVWDESQSYYHTLLINNLSMKYDIHQLLRQCAESKRARKEVLRQALDEGRVQVFQMPTGIPKDIKSVMSPRHIVPRLMWSYVRIGDLMNVAKIWGDNDSLQLCCCNSLKTSTCVSLITPSACISIPIFTTEMEGISRGYLDLFFFFFKLFPFFFFIPIFFFFFSHTYTYKKKKKKRDH
ncbi:hypothetical protein RFI_35803, partial [Reticulomyxa filosa]